MYLQSQLKKEAGDWWPNDQFRHTYCTSSLLHLENLWLFWFGYPVHGCTQKNFTWIPVRTPKLPPASLFQGHVTTKKLVPSTKTGDQSVRNMGNMWADHVSLYLHWIFLWFLSRDFIWGQRSHVTSGLPCALYFDANI